MDTMEAFEAALDHQDEFDVLVGLISKQLALVLTTKDCEDADQHNALVFLNEALDSVADAVALLGGE